MGQKCTHRLLEQQIFAENDADGIRLAREIFEHLNWKEQIKPVETTYKEPRYDADELLVLFQVILKPFDMKEVVARIIDDSDFLEFKQEYDDLTVCGWAKIGGLHIGIITNNGPIHLKGRRSSSVYSPM